MFIELASAAAGCFVGNIISDILLYRKSKKLKKENNKHHNDFFNAIHTSFRTEPEKWKQRDSNTFLHKITGVMFVLSPTHKDSKEFDPMIYRWDHDSKEVSDVIVIHYFTKEELEKMKDALAERELVKFLDSSIELDSNAVN